LRIGGLLPIVRFGFIVAQPAGDGKGAAGFYPIAGAELYVGPFAA
jgi:hypothetical protein